MFKKLAVLAAGIATLGLSVAPASAGIPVPEISLTKTVSTDPGACGTESSIEVTAGTTVYYCYTVTNTGNIVLSAHTLDDDVLGNIFTDFPYDLEPDMSVSTVDAGLTIPAVITEDTVNVGTWTACDTPQIIDGVSSAQQAAPSCIERLTATATATAAVTIAQTPPTTPPTTAAEAAPAVAAVGTPRFTG